MIVEHHEPRDKQPDQGRSHGHDLAVSLPLLAAGGGGSGSGRLAQRQSPEGQPSPASIRRQAGLPGQAGLIATLQDAYDTENGLRFALGSGKESVPTHAAQSLPDRGDRAEDVITFASTGERETDWLHQKRPRPTPGPSPTGSSA